MSARIKVTTNLSRIAPKIGKAKERAIPIVTQEVVKLGNHFVPMDSTTLMKSALAHSQFSEGKAIWQTPYARRQYYGTGNKFSKDKNPNAQAMWAHKALSTYKGQLAQLAERAVKGNL